MSQPTPAVIHIPEHVDLRQWLPVCLDAADRQAWSVVAITRMWRDAARAATEHVAVLLVATRAHLPADRLPRLVVADEITGPPVDAERPQRLG